MNKMIFKVVFLFLNGCMKKVKFRIVMFTTVLWAMQRAKKIVSNSPWLVDFAIGPVNSVLNLPNRRVKLFGEIIQITEELNQSCSSKYFGHKLK